MILLLLGRFALIRIVEAGDADLLAAGVGREVVLAVAAILAVKTGYYINCIHFSHTLSSPPASSHATERTGVQTAGLREKRVGVNPAGVEQKSGVEQVLSVGHPSSLYRL